MGKHEERDWDEFLETGGSDYQALTGPDATVPQGTATGAQKRPVARFGGWRGVLAVCAVMACLGGIFFGRDLQARGCRGAQVAGEDAEGERAYWANIGAAKYVPDAPAPAMIVKPLPEGKAPRNVALSVAGQRSEFREVGQGVFASDGGLYAYRDAKGWVVSPNLGEPRNGAEAVTTIAILK